MKLFTTHKPTLEECPPRLNKNIFDWKTFNPLFDFEYFSDIEMSNWVEKNSSEESYNAFKNINTGAGRADYYRIRKLFVEGGIWFDADMHPTNLIEKVPNLFELIDKHKTVFFVSAKSNEPRFMIMASKFGNPLFEEFEFQLRREINEIIEKNEFISTINLTGPKAFQRILCKYLKYERMSDLKIGDSFDDGRISFVFTNDVVDYNRKGSKISYFGYSDDLISMGVAHHQNENAYKKILK